MKTPPSNITKKSSRRTLKDHFGTKIRFNKKNKNSYAAVVVTFSWNVENTNNIFLIFNIYLEYCNTCGSSSRVGK